jgi:tetratricopeptide (TPR) repeat protein
MGRSTGSEYREGMRCTVGDQVRTHWKLGLFLLLAWAMVSPAALAEEQADQERLLKQLIRDQESVDRAIEGTRDLIQQSMHRPYLPDLYLRLADLYIEKSRILYHLKIVEDPTESRAVVVLEANLLKTKAIDLYNKILDEFPEYTYQDKVIFFMAHEHRELGQYDKMMNRYTDLVERFPESPYRLETFLLIGDYYFDSMNLDKAEEAYQTILAAPESHVHGMARYKMAWCHINRSKYPEALALLEALVADRRYDELKTEIDAYKRINLRREALMDLAYCYTEVKPPEEALAYFADLSDSKSVYLGVLEKLGQRYFLKENWAAGADVYGTIISLSRNTQKSTAAAEKLFACAQRAENMQYPEKNVQMLIRVLEQVEYSWRTDPEEKDRLNKEFEVYARDMATRLHLKAKEKQDKVKFGQAADAYAYYLDYFQQGRQARDILENQAEAMYEAGRYFQAALVYEKLAAPIPPETEEKPAAEGTRGEEKKFAEGSEQTVESVIAEASAGKTEEKVAKASSETAERPAVRDPEEPRKSPQDCLYGAVASFYKALKEQKDLDDLEKLEARQGLRQAGSQYLANYPGAQEAPEVAFNVAWVSYEQGDYKAALDGFRSFIQEYPQSDEAFAAGHLVLDIRKSLDDLDGLIEDARAMLANQQITDPRFRKEVGNILMAAEHRHLEELTVKVKDGAEGSDDALLALGREAQDSGLQELALFNLFVVSKEAEDIPDVLERGKQILAKTQDAKRREDVLATLAHFYFEAADFPNAASYSEKAAELARGEKQADHLIRAAKLQGWMGNHVAAVKDYRKAMPLLPPEKRGEAERELLAQYEALKDTSEILSRYRVMMNREPDELKWVFRYGDTLYQEGRRREATETFKKLDELYARKVSSAPDAVTPEERTFAAQARFYRASQEMEAFRKIAIRGDKIENALIQRKLKAHQAVEAAGLEVAQYASPRWTIASLVMAAKANDEISRFFLEAPEPKGLNMAQKQQYRQLVDDKVRPYREKAMQYRKAALDKAHHVGIFCPEVIACYRALNDGAEPPAIGRGALRLTRGEPSAGQSPEVLVESLYADPGNTSLLRSLAIAYAEQGKVELASLVLHRCLEGNPQDVQSQNLLGLIRLVQGEDQEAYGLFRKVLELDPAMDEARANLVVLNEGYGNFQKARESLSEIADRQTLLSMSDSCFHPDFRASASRLEVVAFDDAEIEALEEE